MKDFKADREELSDIIEQYEQVMTDYKDATKRANKANNDAQASIATTLKSTAVRLFDMFQAMLIIQSVKSFWKKAVEADRQAETNFSTAKTEIDNITSAADNFQQGLGKNGSNLDLLDIQQLQADLFSDNKLLDNLFANMKEGEPLSESERKILYYYIQNQFFDDSKREDIENLKEIFNSDPHALVDHLNNNVLQTENALHEEIALVQLYLFSNELSPEDSQVKNKTSGYLNAYLKALHHFNISVQNMKEDWFKDLDPDDPLLARVDSINWDDSKAANIEMSTEIFFGMFEDYDDGFTEETRTDFLAREHTHLMRGNEIEISYFYGDKSGTFEDRSDLADLQGEYDVRVDNFFTQKLPGIIAGEAISQTSKTLAIASAIGIPLMEHYEESKELAEKIEMKEIRTGASLLSLEISKTERMDSGERGTVTEVELIPTPESYALLDRWKEISDKNPDIPFPEKEDVIAEEWIAISYFLDKNYNEMLENNPELTSYILDGKFY